MLDPVASRCRWWRDAAFGVGSETVHLCYRTSREFVKAAKAVTLLLAERCIRGTIEVWMERGERLQVVPGLIGTESNQRSVGSIYRGYICPPESLCAGASAKHQT